MTGLISSRVTGARSGCWSSRLQAITRYQPSPNGAMKPNASPAALTVSTSDGARDSRTSASMTERTADRPGNGSPSAARTVLRTPSVPTT
jgi:hypothetical protein